MSWFIKIFFGVLLAWALGFAVFLHGFPKMLVANSAQNAQVDALVVVTGGTDRIEHGGKMLKAGVAGHMLISGVNIESHAFELAYHSQISPKEFICCVTIGAMATDTRSNATETLQWLQAHKYKSFRLITNDWHMQRTRLEMDNVLPKDIVIIEDPVPAPFNLVRDIMEYNKYLTRIFTLKLMRL
jgi:uncharacterized SAM-binding protein YcdF (DUF218 family)